MNKASSQVVSMIAGQLHPIGMTLTQEEGEAIMERVRANVMGAVHSGWKRPSLELTDEEARSINLPNLDPVLAGRYDTALATDKPIRDCKMRATAKHEAIYRRGDKIWNAFSYHPQVDSGLGFTCDKEILEIVKDIWRAGMETRFSCHDKSVYDIQSESAPYAEIGITHSDTHALLDFCLHIRQSCKHNLGWLLTLCFDNTMNHEVPLAILSYSELGQYAIEDAINKFGRE